MQSFCFKLRSEFEELVPRSSALVRGLRSLHGVERVQREGGVVSHPMDVQR